VAVEFRKTLHLRAARPQDLRFDVWLDFLAVAAERAPAVWRDLTEKVWPAWRKFPEIALITCEEPLREWAARWHLIQPDGEPARPALHCAIENLKLRAWREENGQPQPPAEYVVPITGYGDVRRGDQVQPQALPVPRSLQRVRFEAAWNVWRTAEPVAAARERILREFERALDEHVERYMQHVERAGYAVEAERRRWRQHLRWFCDFQLNGRSVADLLEAAPDLDERAVRKALREVAEALNLRVRHDRRGRKPRG
jgi:hypothetical protein